MNLELLKKVVSVTAGLGAGQIVGAIVNATTPQATTYQKVTVSTASFVGGMAASEYIGTYTDRKIDEAAAWCRENFKRNPSK
jgi:ABC-type xylose transport system permease subunit